MTPQDMQAYLDRVALLLGQTMLGKLHSDMMVERISAQGNQAMPNGPIDPNDPPPDPTPPGTPTPPQVPQDPPEPK